jgi:hypothetical protein
MDTLFFSLSLPTCSPLPSLDYCLPILVLFLVTCSCQLCYPWFPFCPLVPYGCSTVLYMTHPRTMVLGYKAVYDPCCVTLYIYKDWMLYPEVPSSVKQGGHLPWLNELNCLNEHSLNSCKCSEHLPGLQMILSFIYYLQISSSIESSLPLSHLTSQSHHTSSEPLTIDLAPTENH